MPGWQESTLSLIFHDRRTSVVDGALCGAAGLQGWDWRALHGSKQCSGSGVNSLFSFFWGFCFPGEGLDPQRNTSGEPGEGLGLSLKVLEGLPVVGIVGKKWKKTKFPGKRKKEIRAIENTILCNFFFPGILFALMFLFGWGFFSEKKHQHTLLMSC